MTLLSLFKRVYKEDRPIFWVLMVGYFNTLMYLVVRFFL